MAAYKLIKIRLPFESNKWALKSMNKGEFFGTYKTKKEALADVKEYKLTLIN